MKRLFCILILLILVFCSASAAETDSEKAVDLSRKCDYSSTITRKYWQENITDGELDTHIVFPKDSKIDIRWSEQIGVRYLYWEWYEQPKACTLNLYDGDGELVESVDLGGGYLNYAKELESNISKAVFVATEELNVAEIRVYGEGELPDNYHPWLPEAEKVDFLIVAMHPDDDALFMGAVMPIYGAEQGYTGTILFMATRTRLRCTEALNGAYLMGLRTYPILAGFPDIPSTMPQELKDTFTLEDVTEYLVGQFRKLKPLVVVSHDLEGEYGHWQHKLLAQAVLDAAALSADPSYSPETAAEWGVWEVKKVYLHLYPENTLELATDIPLAAFDGKTAYEIAALAYECHESQQSGVHPISEYGEYGVRYFGLAYSNVGLDSGKNDMFENIEQELLVSYTPPEATITPSPEATATPQPQTDAAESVEPSPSPEPTVTPEVQAEITADPNSPAPLAAEGTEAADSEPMQLLWLILGILLAVLTVSVVVAGILMRKRR
ncbi:MAG: PIG-L family deacetylase [Clostridia bacterium]|nr:PIG-L family deacetylase [Clostridia bacterium]